MEPNKENIKLWLDALVSGEFDQGSGFLRTVGDTYCCLGVACVVAARNGGDEKFANYVAVPGEHSMPPAELNEWLGIDVVEFAMPIAKGDLSVGVDAFRVTPPDYDLTLPASRAQWAEGAWPIAAFTSANDTLLWSFRTIAEKVAARLDIEITYPEGATREAKAASTEQES